MSKPAPVFEDIDSVAESVYYILMNNGDDLLAEYIMSFKWEVPKPVAFETNSFYPDYFQKYMEEYERSNDRLQAFKLDYINKVLADLPNDFAKLKQLFNPNLAEIHTTLNDYFESKLAYLKEATFFALQFKYVSEIINLLFRALPLEINQKLSDMLRNERDRKRDEARRLRDEAREKDEKYDPIILRYYSLTDKSILEQNTTTKFKIVYLILKDLKISGITYNEINDYENKYLKNPKEEDKRKAESYFRNKRTLLTTRYFAEFNRNYKQIQKKFVKMTKKFIKALYKYKDSIVEKPKGEGSSWGI
jgi:hypothetical protein